MRGKVITDNGDGRVVINTWVAVISLILLLITSLSSIIALSVNAKAQIDDNNEKVIECKENIIDAKQSLNKYETRLTKIETHYAHITEQLNRIEKKLEVSQ